MRYAFEPINMILFFFNVDYVDNIIDSDFIFSPPQRINCDEFFFLFVPKQRAKINGDDVSNVDCGNWRAPSAVHTKVIQQYGSADV